MLQIASLSRINHKNFINLIGYCEEEEPFTRMFIFEYAPNGSLSEHLHGNAFCFSSNYIAQNMVLNCSYGHVADFYIAVEMLLQKLQKN